MICRSSIRRNLQECYLKNKKEGCDYMLKHVVTWKIEEENKEASLKKMKALLEALTEKIEVINSMEVGINENGGEYDAILISDFENAEALKIYDEHPEHQEVRKFIRSIAKSRIAVDYNY